MGTKRTGDSELPEGAIVISIDVVGVDQQAAEAVLQEMRQHVGQDRYDLAMDYLYNKLVEDVLTNEQSPLYSVFRQTMARLSAHATEHLHRSHERIEALEGETKQLRTEMSSLRSRLQTLEASLGAARRCLKSDGAKRALQYCRRFNHSSPVGETEVAAAELAETVKNACICIKEL